MNLDVCECIYIVGMCIYMYDAQFSDVNVYGCVCFGANIYDNVYIYDMYTFTMRSSIYIY